MENTLLLHILRNPYGWDGNEVRKARLAAADLIEDLGRQLEFEKSKKRSRGFVGFGLFNRGELVTCSKQELAISIGSQAIECLPLYVMREDEKVDADETAPCHVCGWKDGYHDKRCSGYLVDPETGEPIPTHNAQGNRTCA